jgi:serine/threonine-protein kinase
MALAPGARLGPYEIISANGAGGMGEVYRARDTRLDRTVAIKILPEALAADEQFRERFEREARMVSQLAHPHICVLHDVGAADQIQFLVMEHLEGETLDDRLRKGALPVSEALKVGIQIADALCAAHSAGIVHRDLKPGNIFLARVAGRPNAPQAKLLDFGLAKNAAPVVALSGSMAPTTPPTVTAQGTILGTFQYMAPEQIEGLEADTRTDIFAFGAVLFEMLTGRKAFEGKTRASLLGAILKDEPPPVSQVQPVAPAALDRIVATCLAKDSDDRWQTARDLLRELRWIAEGAETNLKAGQRAATRGRARWLTGVAAAGVALAGMAATGWAVQRWTAAPVQTPMRFAIVPPAAQPFTPGGFDRAVAISPDGRRLVYRSSQAEDTGLMVRTIDKLDAAPIRGLVQPRGPFFSPDGNWIGFFQNNTSELKKVAVTGGPAILICRSPSTDNFGTGPRGASWAPDGTIIFATSDLTTGLFRVPSGGGEAVVLTKPDTAAGEGDHVWPSILPDGDAVLFTVAANSADNAQVAILDLESGARKTLIRGGSGAHYVESGHLVYGVAGTLHAVRFDPVRHEVLGDPVPLIEGVTSVSTAAPDFTVSLGGTLVYVPASTSTRASGLLTLVWVDRQGREEPIGAPARRYFHVRLSPDGMRIAADIRDQEDDVWIWDFARQNLGRLTFNPAVDASPLWFPDGRRIAYSSGGSLVWQLADGTGAAVAVSSPPRNQVPLSFSPDGKQLLVLEQNTKTHSDLVVVGLEGKREAAPLFQTQFSERLGEISPDGRWIVYQSDESGQNQIYVRPFPNVNGGKWLISPTGGTKPVWNRNGRELFFLDSRNALMAVPVQTVSGFSAGNPIKLLEGPYFSPLNTRTYDVSGDGKRFLMIKSPPVTETAPDATPASLVVVLNWFEELKRLVP